jgi:hypothetical protein
MFLLNAICNKKMNLDKGNKKIRQMNEIRYLLEETNNIVFKLYLSGNMDEKEIFIFIDFYIFWFENYSSFLFINEKNRKIKNYIIFKYLFSLVQKIIPKLMKNINKEKLDIIITFIENLKNSEEINCENNLIILLKYNYIQSFTQMLLYNIDFNKIEQINNKFQEILINFLVHFLKFKFNLSNIYNIFLDNLRIGYEHLYNFEDNITKIIKDLKIQNFQARSLKKLIDLEGEIINNKKTPLMNDSFLFNGFDSIISFKIDDYDFLNNCIFFFI